MSGRRKPSLARRIGLAMVFAVVGVVLTYAVAWACSARRALANRAIEHTAWYGEHAARRGWPRGVPEGWPAPDWRSVAPTLGTQIESGSSNGLGAPGTPARACSAVVFSAGWPALALRSVWAAEIGGGDGFARYAAIDRMAPGVYWLSVREGAVWIVRQGGRSEAVYLPVRPTLGFVVNAAGFGVAAWALFVLPRWARRTLRARAGRCVACGYILAGVRAGVCPECGAGASG